MLKFALFVDLGIFTVPANYVLVSEFMGGKFPNPSRILRPGDNLWVCAHNQIVSGTTSSEERLVFLASLGSYFIGAQGIKLLNDHKRNQLPRGYWYSSFDEKERLWEDSERYHRVPGVCVHSDSEFLFGLGYFEEPWLRNHVFFSYCYVPLGA